MLTPSFKVAQDVNHIFINVHAPYTNISDTKVKVDRDYFQFASSPYFLRLQLPGSIAKNDNSKGSYLCDSGDFNFTFEKETAGEHFENLDIITPVPDLVEMLEDGITVEDGINGDNDNPNKYTYGFANKLTAEFSNIGTEFPQIFELSVPETVSIEERQTKRVQHEARNFSADHYLADLNDTELLQPCLTSVAPWCNEHFNKEFEFSDSELGVLKELPNKDYLLSKTEYKQVLYGLMDILYGYCYDKRTTSNVSTVESGWTINKLSSTLSWFCTFNDMTEVLVASYRRALIYPIIRNFKLCITVKNDLVALISKGKKCLLKCMIEIYQMFNASNDARHYLNQLYIKDYLVFLQKCKNEELEELYNIIANIEISKKDLQLELEEFEAAAEFAKQKRATIEDIMANKMAFLSLLTGVHESDDDLDSSDSSDDSSD